MQKTLRPRSRRWYHRNYLRSPHWRDLRERKLAANPVCERCGNGGIMDVHHIRYRNLYDVRLTDLLTLCRDCHHAEHASDGSPKIKKAVADSYLPQKLSEDDVVPWKEFTAPKRRKKNHIKSKPRTWWHCPKMPPLLTGNELAKQFHT